MNLIQAQNTLRKFGETVLQTSQVATILDITPAYASQLLKRLASNNAIFSLKRGLWLIEKNSNPLSLLQHLTAPFPSYLSLQSALYFHEMISQIPEIMYAVTVARTHRLATPLGHYSFHHVNPDFFLGFTFQEKHNVFIATPEKALIDFLYLAPARSRLFSLLPELSLSDCFDYKAAEKMINLIPSKRTQSLVTDKFKHLVK